MTPTVIHAIVGSDNSKSRFLSGSTKDPGFTGTKIKVESYLEMTRNTSWEDGYFLSLKVKTF